MALACRIVFWMIITCPSCSSRYSVNAASFAPSGRKVRCAKCGHSWHQVPETSSENENLPEQQSPVALSPSPEPTEPSADEASADVAAEVQADAAAAPAVVVPPVSAGRRLFGEKLGAAKADHAEKEPAPDALPATSDDVASNDDAGEEEGGTGVTADLGNRFRAAAREAATLRRDRALTVTGWALLALVVIGVIAGGYYFRDAVASFWPASTRVYAALGENINLRGLEFHNVAYERQTEAGLPVLAISGEVHNISDGALALPRLRVGLLDESQKELYHWTFALAETSLAPGEKVSFVTRLSSPPPEARDIELRFAEVEDRVSPTTSSVPDADGDVTDEAADEEAEATPEEDEGPEAAFVPAYE